MTAPLNVDVDLSELEELVRDIPGAENILFSEIPPTMQASLNVFDSQVTDRTPVGATGNLRQSVTTDILGTPPLIKGTVTTPLIYGLPVEDGRRPGRMPPVDAIEYWVQRKLGLSGTEATSVAFLIARAIGRRGTKGAKMFAKGFAAGRPTVEKIWRQFGDKVARKIERKLDE